MRSHLEKTHHKKGLVEWLKNRPSAYKVQHPDFNPHYNQKKKKKKKKHLMAEVRRHFI
jgi:hypothetical protein